MSLSYEEAERLALSAIYDSDGRGMVGRSRNHLYQRVARAILDAARAEGRSSPEPQAVARTGVVHDLKTWPEPFAAVRAGLKPWELRLDDRDFRVGDVLRLREWIPALDAYTGEVEERVVIWKLDGGQFGLPVGYAILSLAALSTPSPEAGREEDLRAEVLAIFKANKMATDERLAILIAERLAPRLSPPAPEPEDPIGDYQLHPKTAALVRRFMSAVAAKLAAAEVKYGYSDGWADPAWQDECRRQLHHHAAKGDPRDVAAYAAFCWHHGWSTAAPEPDLSAENAKKPEPGYEAEPVAITDEVVRYIARYGGMCRDCADEDGVCPASGLPCEPDDCDRAIRHVLKALSYGQRHGYIKAVSPVPVAISREEIARLVHEHVFETSPDELIHQPWQKSWEEPTRPRWDQWTELADAILQRLSNQQGGGS